MTEKMTDKEFVPFGAEVYVFDIEKSLDFYQNVLGFKVVRNDPSHNFVSFEFNGAIFMIEERKDLVGPTKGIVLRFLVPDLEQYYNEVLKKGVEILKPLATKDYGSKRFYVKDPDGYQLKFANK